MARLERLFKKEKKYLKKIGLFCWNVTLECKITQTHTHTIQFLTLRERVYVLFSPLPHLGIGFVSDFLPKYFATFEHTERKKTLKTHPHTNSHTRPHPTELCRTNCKVVENDRWEKN